MNKNRSLLPRVWWLAFAAAAALAVAAALTLPAGAQEETEGAAPAALEATIWDPAAAHIYTYTSGTLNPTLVVTLLGSTSNVNFASASAEIINPATGVPEAFSGVIARPLFPGISNSAVITAAGFPLYKAVGGERMRLRFLITPQEGGAALSSPLHFIAVEPNRAYVPIVYRDYTLGFNVSGRVYTGIGTNMPNVRVQTTAGQSGVSDAAGAYLIRQVLPGNTILTPQSLANPNAAFIPEARGVTVGSDVTGQDFVWKDDNPCRAVGVESNVAYPVWSYDAYDFLSLNLSNGTTSTVIMTVTNVSGAGQMQFRSPTINSDCSATLSTNRIDPFAAFTSGGGQWAVLRYYGVRPNVYYARWSGDGGAVPPGPYVFTWSAIPGTSPYEPNNNSCEAAPINFGDVHYAYPEDAEDWYQFDVATASNVQITVTNYVATGQYQVWRQVGTCSQLNPSPPLAIAGGSPGLVTMSLANLQPGRYFLRFATVGNFNAGTAYAFRVSTGSGVAKIDTCSPSGKPNCELQSGSGATIYWFNMVGVTSLTLRLDGQNISGGTCGSQAVGKVYGPVTISNPAANGSYTFANVATGYYAAGGQWSPPAGSGDSKPLKMNCTLLNAVPSLAPPVIGPQRPEVTIVNPTFYPELVPVPLPSQPDAPPGQILPSFDATPMP